MNFVQTSDGVKIAYKTAGDGLLAILFMHGWSGSGAYFNQTLKYLDLTSLRAVTMDLRGHGDSDKSDTGYTDERLAKDALAVMDRKKIKKFVVVGFSMSGRFAQYLPILAPERILGQVLVAGCPAFPIPFPEETRRDWVERSGNAERLMELLSMFITRPVEQSVLDQFGIQAAKASKTALDETLGICIKASFVDKLKLVNTPTLVVGGLHDPIFSPDALREGVVGRLRRARLAVLDCNHEIPIEQPRELAGLIEAFVAGSR